MEIHRTRADGAWAMTHSENMYHSHALLLSRLRGALCRCRGSYLRMLLRISFAAGSDTRARSATTFARYHATAHRYGLFRLLDPGHERICTYMHHSALSSHATRKNIRLTLKLPMIKLSLADSEICQGRPLARRERNVFYGQI